jgi:IrrE N-terminal-like domain
MLNGGRATFIPDATLILHENVGTPFERAFLVAHEIGHVELGDDPDAKPILNIDPTRSSEPSPVRIDRVVDYSSRQRREVQMDLFAREFLLPRSVVRKLHVEEGLTASQIAEKFGAPFEVVSSYWMPCSCRRSPYNRKRKGLSTHSTRCKPMRRTIGGRLIYLRRGLAQGKPKHSLAVWRVYSAMESIRAVFYC